MLSGTAQVSQECLKVFFFFFFGQCCLSSCVCDYGGQKQDCRLLFATHIGHKVIRKEEKKA